MGVMLCSSVEDVDISSVPVALDTPQSAVFVGLETGVVTWSMTHLQRFWKCRSVSAASVAQCVASGIQDDDSVLPGVAGIEDDDKTTGHTSTATLMCTKCHRLFTTDSALKVHEGRCTSPSGGAAVNERGCDITLFMLASQDIVIKNAGESNPLMERLSSFFRDTIA